MMNNAIVITKPLSKFEAEQNRDAMSKSKFSQPSIRLFMIDWLIACLMIVALYSSLFNYIVTRINDELFLVKARQEGLKVHIIPIIIIIISLICDT